MHLSLGNEQGQHAPLACDYYCCVWRLGIVIKVLVMHAYFRSEKLDISAVSEWKDAQSLTVRSGGDSFRFL